MFSPVALVALLSALTPWASAQSATPAAPGLTFLYSLNCTLAPAYEMGYGPKGVRVAIPITGGTFSGPRLNGTVSNLGADWGLTDNQTGIFSADTRYNLVTSDGANIFIQTSGPSQPDGHLHLRLLFETGHPDYYWLNNIVAVGILSPPADASAGSYVSIDAWQLDSPA